MKTKSLILLACSFFLIKNAIANEASLIGEVPVVAIEKKLESFLPQKSFFSRELSRQKSFPFFDKASKLEAAGNLSGAVDELEKYLEVDDKNYIFIWRAIIISARLGRFNRVLSLSEHLLSDIPDFYPAKIYQGVAWLALDNNEKFQAAFLETSLKKLAAEEHQTAVSLKVSLAYLLKEQGLKQKSIEALSLIAEELHDNDKATLLKNAGYILEQDGENKKAFELLLNAWQSDKNLKTFNAMIETAYKAEKLDTAYTLAVASLPYYTKDEVLPVFDKICTWQTESGKYPEALACMEQFIKLAGESKETVTRMAEIARLANDTNAIKKTLLMLEKISPDHVVLTSLAQLKEKEKNDLEAAALYEKSFNLGGQEGINSGISALYIYKKTEEWQKLIILAEKMLLLKTISDEQHSNIQLNLAYAYAKTGDQSKLLAIADTIMKKKAMTTEDKISLGFILIEMDRKNEAIALFWDAYNTLKTGEQAGILANALESNKRHGLSAWFFEKSLEKSKSKEEKIHALESLGYLYYDMSQPQLAVERWQEAIKLGGNPLLKLRLAQALTMAGEPEMALQSLEEVEEKIVGNAELTIVYNETKSTALSLVGENELALLYLEKLIKDEPTAARLLEKALVLQKLDRHSEAKDVLIKATELEPENSEIRLALAYHLAQLKENQQAANEFERVLATQPDYLMAREDLGYSYAAIGEKQKAIQSFTSVIKQSNLYGALKNYTPEQERSHIYRLKRQNTILGDDFSLLAYTGFCPFSDACKKRTTPLGGGEINEAQGGIEASLRLAHIGYRDGRIFAFTGRVFGANEESSSIAINEDTIQGGLGLRYKPLKMHDMHLAFERLFKIGSETENNWLTRISYGFASSLDVPPDENFANWYYSLYLDGGKYLQNAKSYIGTGELRLGAKLRTTDRSLVVPFAFLGGSKTDGKNVNEHYSNTGIGALYRYWYNENEVQAPESYVDIEGKLIHDINDNRAEADNRFILNLKTYF